MNVNLKRYALWFIAATIGLFIVVFALDYFLAMEFPNGAAAVIPAMVAAMVEGQKYAETSRDPVPSPWKQAGALTIVGSAISIVFAIPAFIFLPELRGAFSQFPSLMIGMIVFGILITWVVNRIFLTIGAKNQWKAMDRQAGQ